MDGWPELLKHARVLVLAEAGSGKTIEMKEQTKRLVGEGKFAFFIALELLDREPLVDLLSSSEQLLLRTWLQVDLAPAWFFLDAVDELKLTDGKFDRAIRRFARAIDGHLGRARIIISCRPHDWRPVVDMTTVRDLLPITRQPKTVKPSPDEIFLAALRRERGDGRADHADPAATDTVRTVILTPLSRSQIERLARGLNVTDAEAFLAEINRQNAWIFARRPLDLSELVMTWSISRRLGTRVEQHEANIATKLRDDPDRPDHNVLPDTRARIGAERLALALALTRTRTIRSPEQTLDPERTEGVLDPAQILPDWREDERRTLLRRALFDPATYGRVRFHHRSVQEYLAACCLKRLRGKGMATRAVLRLLFAQRYGVAVVVPSMRAIAAWLALWDEVVRRELMEREPEALLALGDPEALPLDARANLVRAFVLAYGEGGWRGLNVPLDEVRRLADPALSEIVQKIWGAGPANTDVRELLLELIWQGAMKGCADIAFHAARDMDLPYHHRVLAIRALLACDRDQEVRSITNSLLSEASEWPGRVVSGLASDLFPRILSVAELTTLIERHRGSNRGIESFAWSLEQMATKLDPATELAVEFRDALTDLLWRGRDSKQDIYQIRSRHGDVVPALARLCARQIALRPNFSEPTLIRACAVAVRFSDGGMNAGNQITYLREYFRINTKLREAMFWAELTMMDELTPTDDSWMRLFNVVQNGLLEHIQQSDSSWLETALTDTRFSQRRPVVLYALINLWRERGQAAAWPELVRPNINDDPCLSAILTENTASPKPDPVQERLRHERCQRQRGQLAREEQRISDWKRWRAALLADPIGAFSPETEEKTIENLYNWLDAQQRARNHYDNWDFAALSEAFGLDVATKARVAIQSLWRRQKPPILWSERLPEQRHSIPWSWIYGLCGVSSEAVSNNWSVGLTADEARVATAYATVELNGFAGWIRDIAYTHPDEVNAVLGQELDAELATGDDHDHLPVLHDLARADIRLKRVMAPRLIKKFMAWSLIDGERMAKRWIQHLDLVTQILDQTIEGVQRAKIAEECERRFTNAPMSSLSRTWLRGLYRFDFKRGVDTLENGLAIASEPDRAVIAIGALATLFTDDENSATADGRAFQSGGPGPVGPLRI